jgi:DNA-binding beta-propeller fold protein YncE
MCLNRTEGVVDKVFVKFVAARVTNCLGMSASCAGLVWRGLFAGTADCSYATGFNAPRGLAFDPTSGVLYVINTGSNTVCRVSSGGGAFASVFEGEEGVNIHE